MSNIINALSVDVEDWYQVGAFEQVVGRDDWDAQASRVVDNTRRLIDLFAQAGVRATFFTLGYVAERHPNLVRAIVTAGHEIASHGYDHRRVFTLSPDQFRSDLRRARGLIEQAGGVAVTGYRAPSFSIDARTPWAHPILTEEGYAYSSSVSPIRHDHYGWRQAPRFAFRPVEGSPLVELPVTTVEVGGWRMAAGGGGFFRLFPYAFSRWAIDRVNRRDGRPVITYFHPWEIDPGQPRAHGASLKSRMRHYARLDAMEAKLARLLGGSRWGPMNAVAAGQASAPVWTAP